MSGGYARLADMSKGTTSSGGIGICGVLVLIFLTLKLAEVGTVAAWSWWWVFSPLWLPLAIAIPIGLFALAVVSVHEWYSNRYMRRMMDE